MCPHFEPPLRRSPQTLTTSDGAHAERSFIGGPRQAGALLAFTLAAGALDAASYIGLGRVFTANMTGNTALFAIALVKGDGSGVARSGTALVGFCLGVAVGVLTRGPAAEQLWLVRVRWTVAIGLLALVGLAVGWTLAGPKPTGSALYPLIGAAAIAMGLQSAANRPSHLKGVPTTYMTGTITRMVESAVLRVRGGAEEGEESASVRAGVWLLYIAGALAGALAERSWHAGVVAIPGVLTAGVLIVALRAARGAASRAARSRS